jgi:hypothetical protein
VGAPRFPAAAVALGGPIRAWSPERGQLCLKFGNSGLEGADRALNVGRGIARRVPLRGDVPDFQEVVSARPEGRGGAFRRENASGEALRPDAGNSGALRGRDPIRCRIWPSNCLRDSRASYLLAERKDARVYRAREVNLTRGTRHSPALFQREASELTGDVGVQGQDFVPKHAFTRYGWVTDQFFRETHRTLARGDRSHGVGSGRDQQGD